MSVAIAFPRVDAGSQTLVIPPEPRTPANTGLASYAGTAETRRTLSCSLLLQGQTLQQAEREAARLLDEMLANTEVFMTFGTNALDGVNDLIERLLHEVEPEKIPELTAIMKQLNGKMRGIRRKYDVSDPKVRDKYANWRGGFGRFFGRVRSLVDLLMDDVRSVESQLNQVAKQLDGRQHDLRRNVLYYDELYDQNEAEIGKLIYVIGVMELIRDLATKRASEIVVGDAQLGDREGERKAAIAEFANNMDNRITEYKSRLFIAWATAPQVRAMRSLQVALAARINTLLTITIPTMKATIVQWRLLMQTMDAALMAEVVAESSNEWLQAYAAAGAELVPQIAQVVNTPTLSIASVEAMVSSIETQADGILDAVKQGQTARANLESALAKGATAIRDTTRKLSDGLVDEIVGESSTQLNIATRVLLDN